MLQEYDTLNNRNPIHSSSLKLTMIARVLKYNKTMHVATKKTIYWCNKLVISLRFLWKKRHRDRRIWYQTVQYYVKLLFVKVELVQKKCKLWVLEDKEQPMIEQQREFYSRHGFSYKIWTTSVSFGCFFIMASVLM